LQKDEYLAVRPDPLYKTGLPLMKGENLARFLAGIPSHNNLET
jgi:hypothetical protein